MDMEAKLFRKNVTLKKNTYHKYENSPLLTLLQQETFYLPPSTD